MHPMWRQTKLRGVCADYKIHVSAYSPLGAPGNLWGTTAVVENPVIKSISVKHQATPAQVMTKDRSHFLNHLLGQLSFESFN